MSGERSVARDDDTDGEGPRPPPRGLPVLAWGLGIYGACRALQIFLEAQATAAAVGQAVLVEWATSRLGIVWTPLPAAGSSAPATTRPADALRRGLTGAAVGLAAAGVVHGVLVLSGGATLEVAKSPSVAVLAIGLVTAGLLAWRDELLFHGVTLRALGMFDAGDHPDARDVFRVVACGVTTAGAALGRSDASARTIVSAALLGIVFGALWTRDRAAWMPWGGHTAFRFATETLLAGGVVHTRLAANGWAGGDAGLFGGTAAVVALLPLATAAIVTTTRGLSPDPARVG